MMEGEVMKIGKKAIVPVKKLAVRAAETRLKSARNHYTEMQNNWYMFAKDLKEIRDAHDHDALGAESFQKLCEREFPLLSYSLVSRFIQIAEKLGEQIDKRLEATDYRLPTYETCYQLTTIQPKIEESEYNRLSKQILDEKLTVQAFRDRIKELVSTTKKQLRAKIDQETDAFMEQTQKELDRDLRESGINDNDLPLLDDEDFEPEDGGDVEDVDDVGESVSVLVALGVRVDYLIDNLPDFVEQVEKIDGPTKSLLKRLKKLSAIIDETVDTIEEK
jgi:hypothetical protein